MNRLIEIDEDELLNLTQAARALQAFQQLVLYRSTSADSLDAGGVGMLIEPHVERLRAAVDRLEEAFEKDGGAR